jgi:hypothetical protein
LPDSGVVSPWIVIQSSHSAGNWFASVRRLSALAAAGPGDDRQRACRHAYHLIQLAPHALRASVAAALNEQAFEDLLDAEGLRHRRAGAGRLAGRDWRWSGSRARGRVFAEGPLSRRRGLGLRAGPDDCAGDPAGVVSAPRWRSTRPLDRLAAPRQVSRSRRYRDEISPARA